MEPAASRTTRAESAPRPTSVEGVRLRAHTRPRRATAAAAVHGSQRACGRVETTVDGGTARVNGVNAANTDSFVGSVPLGVSSATTFGRRNAIAELATARVTPLDSASF